MTTRKLALVIGLLLMSVGFSARAGASSPLSDRVEAVVVKGSQLPAALIGQANCNYRVFADAGAGLEAIPFQIEERSDQGVILVENGQDKPKLDGKFDGRDELVFMASDMGAAPGAAPAGCSKSAVVTAKDKKTGAAGQVLVAWCESPPPLSSKDYISYDLKKHTVTTGRYRMGWQKARAFSYDYLSIDGGPDVMDRLKVRAKVGKFGIVYTFNEDDFEHAFVGYTDGPVRVSVRLNNVWSLGPLGELPLYQTYHFYRETAFQRATMDLNVNPMLIGLVINVEIGHDMEIKDPKGSRVCTNTNPQCDPVDSPADKIAALSKNVMDWGGIDSPGGDVMIRHIPDPRLGVRVQGLYTYDPNYESKPEYSKGSLPLISFDLVDWPEVKPDLYNLDFYYYFLKQYSGPEFARYDRTVTEPLAVEATQP